MLVSQALAEVDNNVLIPPAKEGHPFTKTKGNIPVLDTTDVTPSGRRSSTHQLALHKQNLQQTTCTSGRRHTEN